MTRAGPPHEAPSPGLDVLLLPEKAAQGLSPPLHDVQALLLLYKSFFVGAWFEQLCRQQDDPDVRDTLLEISRRGVEESRAIIDTLQQWEGQRPQGDLLDRLRVQAREQFLRDLLRLKETATEVGLLAAMRAPTADLRDALVKSADVDRENGDKLRALLGMPTVPARRHDPPQEGESLGAHGAGAPGDLVSSRVRRTMEALRERGDEPVRLVVSDLTLRHLRDEGVVRAAEGTALGLPVTVDFGWRGHCFAVLTGESVSLAELYTSQNARDDALL